MEQPTSQAHAMLPSGMHSYQVPYCPKGCADDQTRWPTIRVKASDAEQAQQLAAWTTSSPVRDATRIDD